MDRDDRLAHLTQALRLYADEAAQAGHAFAREQGLHRTDGAALLAVLRAEFAGEPLTPGRLGGELALSSGATTAVLDRLERQGHLRRTADTADRRRVVLHHGEAGAVAGAAWFGPLGAATRDALAAYSDTELDLVLRVLGDVTTALTRHRAANRTGEGS